MKIYVCGPMTGHKDLNFPLFNAVTAELRAHGHEVVNPVEINSDPAAGWNACMRADIAQLVTCEAIAVLPGWTTSKGACLEIKIGAALEMLCRPFNEFLTADQSILEQPIAA